MSLLQFDGFDTEGNEWVRYTNIYEAHSSVDRDGSVYRSGGSTGSLKCYKENGWNTEARFGKTFDITTNTLVTGFGFRTSGFPSDGRSFCAMLDRNTTKVVSLNLNTSGKIQVYEQNSSTLLATGNTILSANTQYYIQFKQISDRLNGTIIVTLNNSSEIELYGLNIATYPKVIDSIYQRAGTNSSVLSMWFDDLYIVNDDNTSPSNFIGTVAIKGLLPTGVGDVMDFSFTGAASSYESIDDIAVSTSDFIFSSILNQKALFNFNDITTTNKILSLIIYDYSARSEAGQGTSKYKLLLRNISDTEYELPEINLFDANYRLHAFMLNKNPISDSTQTVSDINDLQIGAKITQID